MKKEQLEIEKPFITCPYCGKSDKPCSELTSLARAYSRNACRKNKKQ
jgi:hypothetical protein